MKDGGPAFPVFGYEVNENGALRLNFISHPGLSKVEWFAGMAMNGWYASFPPGVTVTEKEMKEAVSFSFRTAEAMLAEAERRAKR